MKKTEELSNDYQVKPEGHLVALTCGHRGHPNRAEEKRISRLLRKSGFIPLLEEINFKKKEQELALQEAEKKTNDLFSKDARTASSNSIAKIPSSRATSRGKMPLAKIDIVRYNESKSAEKSSKTHDTDTSKDSASSPKFNSDKEYSALMAAAAQGSDDDEDEKKMKMEFGRENKIKLLPIDE